MEEIKAITTREYTNKTLAKATATINKLGNQIRRNLLEVAAVVAAVDEAEAYKDDGFQTVHEWTAEAFGFKKSSSYNMLRVGGEFLTIQNGKVMGSNLLDSYENGDFNATQLVEMLPLGQPVAREAVQSGTISPDMTVKEVRAAVRELTRDPEEVEDEEQEAQTEEQEAQPEAQPEEQVNEAEYREWELSCFTEDELISELIRRGWNPEPIENGYMLMKKE